MTNDAKFKN